MSKIKHELSHIYPRIISGIIVLAFLLILWGGAKASFTQADPLYGARTEYSDSTYNEELSGLISNYYNAYSSGDVDELLKYANPVSDMERDYIVFMSGYIDSYDVLEIFSKPGAEEGSFLVSVNCDVNFKDVEDASPGLDFFYVKTGDDGKLFIDNRYSAFNQLYDEEPTDEMEQALYDEFEIQEDVNLLRIRIQNDYNALMERSDEFADFINNKLPQAATQWALDYQAAIDAAIAEEEAKRLAAEEEAQRLAQEEADRKAAEEAAAEEERQRAEEEARRAEAMANAVQMITNSKVNIRENPSEDAPILGYAEDRTIVVKYRDEGEWAVIDYYGGEAYIRSDLLDPYEG